MPYPRKTFSQIKAEVAADITSSVQGADGQLRYSNLGVLGRMLSAYANGLYGYLDWIAKQATPFTATDVALEAWAALKGVFRKGAQAATGQATFAAASGTVPSGTSVQRSDGTLYTTVGDATAAGNSVTVNLQAKIAGSAGTLVNGQAMTLGVAIAGITSTGEVTAVTLLGIDVELDDPLRSRMLQAYANPPMGGSAPDFVRWALQVPGVTRAWPVREGMGPGTVVVLFMMDTAEAAHGGFPQGSNGAAMAETRVVTKATGDQLTVANALYGVQPVIARVWAVAPATNTVTFTIAGIAGASSATKAAINAAIDAVFLAQGAPGGPVDLSYIESAIGAISGTAGFVITAVACTNGTVTPGGDGNITSSAGYLPVRGAITYA